MPSIGRKDLVLLLVAIGAPGEPGDGIGGITRLQKYLYLLGREQNILPHGDGFDFAAYKAGPCSWKLYDDLEFLENLGLIESEVVAEATEGEALELEMLSFEDLMGDSASRADDGWVDGFGAADAYDERKFRVTVPGAAHIRELVASGQYAPVIDAIRRVKSRFGSYSLTDILYYVYTKYPEMATESEIRNKVLRRRSRL